MARLIHLWTRTKLDLKAYAKSANDLIKRTEGQYMEIAEQVQAGQEEREVDCYWSYDTKQNLKRLYRCDTGLVVSEEAMTTDDLQRCLNFQTEQSVANVNAMSGEVSGTHSEEQAQGDTDHAVKANDASQANFGSDEQWPEMPAKE